VADIVLFGATGYTGRLTTEALARRGLDFAIAGRDPSKLESIARAHGNLETRLAEVGDVDSLVRALDGASVLVTCVGPFSALGWTAVEAALRAGVNYVDSTAEGKFIHRLKEDFDAQARTSGVALAPAMGFDEIPSDVAVSLAVEGLDTPEVVVTYAVPTTATQGTIRSALDILTSPGWMVSDGRLVETRTGERDRWAPLPPPLGVRRCVSAPLSIGRIAPMHLAVDSLDVYMTSAELQRLGLKLGLPAARVALSTGMGRWAAEAIIGRLPEGPGSNSRRKRWTVMAEAKAGHRWRNVVLTGQDVYGLTGELLAFAAAQFLRERPPPGVLAPVEALGLEILEKELIDRGVSIDAFDVGE
jgi:short subunit dehydrogenase-like uncharacterized protein